MKRARILTWNEVEYDEEDPEWNPDDDYYEYRILAEGDSWFSSSGNPGSNLLFPMRFREPTVIVNCASSGNCQRLATRAPGNIDFYHAISESHGSRWDAILLSCGAMHLIKNAGQIIRSTDDGAEPSSYCDQARLQEQLQVIRASYRTVIELRDGPNSSCSGKPVIAHSYDWITPRNAPSRFFGIPLSGAYLYKALSKAQIDPVHWNAISDYLIGRLRDTLLELSQGDDALPNFHVVTGQDTLKRADPSARGNSHDWSDEAHPTADGYKKLSGIVESRIYQLLP